MNKLTSFSKHSMLTRIITALVLVCICVPCLFLGGWFFLVLVGILTVVSIYEIVHAAKIGNYTILIYLICLAIAFLIAFCDFLFDANTIHNVINYNEFYLRRLILPIPIVILGIVAIFILPLCIQKFSIPQACYVFAFSLYLGLAFQGILYLRYLPNGYEFYNHEVIKSSLLLVYIVCGSVFNDVGAYFVGVLFGKHPMCERLSPKKTWEGFIGGVSFSMLTSLTLAGILHSCNLAILPGVLDFNFYSGSFIVLISIVVPIASVIGDLLFSAVKRYYGIKDFSNILPGHGGFLDRLDSLSFTCLVVSCIIFIIVKGLGI